MFIIVLILLLFIFPPANTQESAYQFPRIERLNPADDSFRQYLSDVENNRRRLSQSRIGSGEIAEFLTIYQYTPGANEDIFFLAARCNIPYSALVSLNRLTTAGVPEKGKPLLLPSCPGIFLPETPQTELEKLTGAARFSNEESVELKINIEGVPQVFHFFPGSDFTPAERTFFLNPGFKFPLKTFRLTSRYGERASPFTGNLTMHNGIDMAAPEGTEVYAVADGIVTETGFNNIYGNYIIISHRDNITSFYGHLQKIETVLHAEVKSTSLIGRVGTTGQSTGPHLHFELRQNGRPTDPAGRLRPLF